MYASNESFRKKNINSPSPTLKAFLGTQPGSDSAHSRSVSKPLSEF